MKANAVVLLVVGFAAAAVAREKSGDYKVVINAANPQTTLTRAGVSRLFLRKTTTWPNGQIAAPVDQPTSSPCREAFSKGVLGMQTSEVAGYLNQLIFTGRGLPPLTKPSDAEVLAYVRGNPNAIGYVTDEAALGEGVKVMTVKE